MNSVPGSSPAPDATRAEISVSQSRFGTTPDGPATLFTLQNARGIRAQVAEYGGILTSLLVPGRDGVLGDVVLGFDTLDEYVRDGSFFGALVGRYANRIANGRFALDGITYQLATNQAAHHLHGGARGFNKRLWRGQEVSKKGAVGVELRLLSPDGEENYPGDLNVQMTYWLNESGDLTLDYRATTDRPTILNLTNHSYFNLAGAGQGAVLDHRLLIEADRFTPVRNDKIPTGELREVAGTPFDFRQPTPIGARITALDEQLCIGNGYDHNFVLRDFDGRLRRAAQVTEPLSGRQMEVWTTQPGVQFFSGNLLNSQTRGKGGKVYDFRSAFCLETQHFPDSPNQNVFPNAELRPDQTYRQTTLYRFGLA